MVIKVLDPVNFSLLGVVTDAETVHMTKRCYAAGDFEIILSPTKMDADKLKKGRLIVIDNDGDLSGLIVHRERDISTTGDTLKIIGRDILHLLNQRITVPASGSAYDQYSGKAETILKTHITRHLTAPTLTARQVPNLVVAQDLLRGITAVWQSRYEKLSNTLSKFSDYAGLPFRIRADLVNKRFEFDVFPGIDRTAGQSTNARAVFNLSSGNIESLNYVDSDLDTETTVYGGGSGDGSSRLIYISGNSAVGLNRSEYFADCGTATVSELPDLTAAKVTEKQPKIRLTANVTLQPLRYRIDYNLGDLVTISFNDSGDVINSNFRITEITEEWSNGSYKVKATFGSDIPSLASAIRRDLNNRSVR